MRATGQTERTVFYEDADNYLHEDSAGEFASHFLGHL